MENYFLPLLPLLLFAIVESFADLKKALYAAIAMALLELGYTVYKFGTIDIVTGTGVSLVLAFAFFAYKKESSIIFKIQPAVFSWLFSLLLIFTTLNGEPFFITLISKYRDLVPQADIMLHPQMRPFLSLAHYTIGTSLILHGLLCLYAAFKLNTWWWVAIRGVGFIVFQALGVFAARLLIVA